MNTINSNTKKSKSLVKVNKLTTTEAYAVLKLVAEGYSMNYAVATVLGTQNYKAIKKIYEIMPRIKEIVELKTSLKKKSLYLADNFKKLTEQEVKELVKKNKIINKTTRRRKHDTTTTTTGTGTSSTKETSWSN